MVSSAVYGDGNQPRTGSLLNVSDAGRRKNIPALIEAFALLRREYHHATLDLVGPGLAESDDIAQRARATGQADGVHFRGVLDRAAVAAALAAATVFVHPSREESFGLSVAEAMAAGVPVVAGRTSGAVPWVLGGTGLLVDVESPKEIAEAIRTLLDDSNLAEDLAARARRRARETFSPEIVAGSYLEIYEDVLSKHGRRAA
jgi:glycosyltransferase involved in cell wall biosynthesis